MIDEATARGAASPGPEYSVKMDIFKRRSMSINFVKTKTGRTDAIKKVHSTDFYETREAVKNSQTKAGY